MQGQQQVPSLARCRLMSQVLTQVLGYNDFWEGGNSGAALSLQQHPALHQQPTTAPSESQ
jgi:hypothetical protein